MMNNETYGVSSALVRGTLTKSHATPDFVQAVRELAYKDCQPGCVSRSSRSITLNATRS